MKALQSLRYKTKVGLLLAALLGCLLINNIVGQESFASIQKDARSIYEDRLMPSTFIFDLQEHLYEEQGLLRQAERLPSTTEDLQRHRASIAALVTKYEKTALTPDERGEWLRFKAALAGIHAAPAAQPGASIDAALRSLTRLNAIQAGVAKDLETRMTAEASASTIRSYLELSLLIVIGAVTLSLIGYSRNAFQKTVSHRPSLN